MGNTYYIGWDVGAWHCNIGDTPKSKDALFVISSPESDNLSKHYYWQGNLLAEYPQKDFFAILKSIFDITFDESDKYYLAIDASLGVASSAFDVWNLSVERQIDKIELGCPVVLPQKKITKNSYTFRYTEDFISEYIFAGVNNIPKSVVKDRIGCQSIKALEFLRLWGMKWNPDRLFWERDDYEFYAYETYPAASRQCPEFVLSTINNEVISKEVINRKDIEDAYICAATVKFIIENGVLFPQMAIKEDELKRIEKEGWIWLPTKEINRPCPTQLKKN